MNGNFYTQPAFVLALACMLIGMTLRLFSRIGRAELRSMWFLVVLGLLALLSHDVLQANGAEPVARVLDYLGIACVAFAILHLTITIIFQLGLPLFGVRPPRIAQDLTLTGCVIACGLYGLGLMGVRTSELFTTSAILTGLLAFSMQETLGNVLGGVVLQLDNSLQVGDFVRIDDQSGKVVDVRWRYTAIVNNDRETVVIPNSWLMKNRFRIVHALPNEPLIWRRTLTFNIDPSVQPVRAVQVINQAVADANIAKVSGHKAVNTILADVTVGYCRYALRYWLTDPESDSSTDSQVRMHVLAALQRNRIELAGPVETSRDLANLGPDLRTKERARARRLSTVKGTTLFSSLGLEQQDQIAQCLVPAYFLKGSVITRQGAVANWLYMIVEGQAEVSRLQGDVAAPIAKLNPGDYFGEMGLLTGEPRRASVNALTDVFCYRLEKEGFAEVLRTYPEVADEIVKVLNQRKADMSMVLRIATSDQEDGAGQAVLARIKSFFGIKR